MYDLPQVLDQIRFRVGRLAAEHRGGNSLAAPLLTLAVLDLLELLEDGPQAPEFLAEVLDSYLKITQSGLLLADPRKVAKEALKILKRFEDVGYQFADKDCAAKSFLELALSHNSSDFVREYGQIAIELSRDTPIFDA